MLFLLCTSDYIHRLALLPVVPGSDEDSWYSSSDDGKKDPEFSDDSDDDEDEQGEIFPEWLEVHISYTTKSQMLLWARMARQNLRERRRLLITESAPY